MTGKNRNLPLAACVSAFLLAFAAPGFAQTAPAASAPPQIPNANAIPPDLDCAQRLTVAGQQGEAQRKAGAQEIFDNQPKFSEMNCLGDLLDGSGLDLFGVGFDIMGMLNKVKSQVCSAGQSLLNTAKSQSQGCGIYASGWNMGVPGYGMSNLCRSVYVGGGGGDIFGVGTRRPSTGFGNVFGRSPDAGATSFQR